MTSTKSKVAKAKNIDAITSAFVNAAFTTADNEPVIKQAKKAPIAEPTIITGLSHNAKSYNGYICTVVQELPKVDGVRYMLVKVDDFAKHGLQEYIAVRPENLTSPSRSAAAAKQVAALTKVHEEIAAYLVSIGFKKESRDTWQTKGRTCYVTVYMNAEVGDSDSIDIAVTTHFNLYDLVMIGAEDDFEVSSLAEFKRYMKDTFQNLVKDAANKDFQEVVRVATALCAPTKTKQPKVPK